MKSARATLLSNLMRKEDFIGKSLADGITESIRAGGTSPYAERVDATCRSELVAPGIVRIEYATELHGLRGKTAIKHKYAFPLLDDVREKAFIVEPGSARATSELLIPMKSEKRGYFNVGVHDCDNRLLCAEVLIYDHKGKVAPYRALRADQFVSPLSLGEAWVRETADEDGRRVLRLYLALSGLGQRETLRLGYTTAGIQLKSELEASPDAPVVRSDLRLEDNDSLVCGDWVLGVTDAEDRLLVNCLIGITPC